MSPLILPSLLAVGLTTAWAQGVPTPVPGEEHVPNISIRVDRTGGAARRHSPPDPTLTLRRTGGREFSVSPRLGEQAGIAATTVSQFVTVANGSSGSILVTKRVPYLEWLTTFGRDWAPPREGFDFQFDEVGAYMNVHAQTGGSPAEPWVYITLTPELRGQVDGRAERVVFTRASTRVVAANGRTLPVGGAGRSAAFFGKFMNDTGPRGTVEPVRLSVTPTLLFTPRPDAGGPREIKFRPLGPPVKDLRLDRPNLPPPPKMRLPNWAK